MASAIDFTNSGQQVEVKLRERPKSAGYKTSTFQNIFGKVEGCRRQKPLEATLLQKLQSDTPSPSVQKRCRPLSVCPITGHLVGANNLEFRQLENRTGEVQLGRENSELNRWISGRRYPGQTHSALW